MKPDDLNKLVSGEVKLLLAQYAETPPEQFLLKFSGKPDLPLAAIATQLKCRQKAKQKLRELPVENMFFDTIPLEQASSSLTARYKFKDYQGARAVDITGGLGIDALFLSENFREVYHFELSEVLSGIANYNSGIVGRGNINFIQGDSIEMLRNFPDKHFDLLYADPARRENTRRAIDLRYLKPDLLENYELLKSKARTLLFKLSPAFDVAEALKLFPEISLVRVVSVNDECKELILEITPGYSGSPEIEGVELNRENNPASCRENHHKLVLDVPKANDCSTGYVYEAYCGIAQAGLGFCAANKHNLSKTGSSRYYFHSTDMVKEFPGKIYKVISLIPYNLKKIKSELSTRGLKQVNVKARGNRIKPEEVSNKLKIKNGGNHFLFIYEAGDSFEVLLCEKISG